MYNQYIFIKHILQLNSFLLFICVCVWGGDSCLLFCIHYTSSFYHRFSLASSRQHSLQENNTCYKPQLWNDIGKILSDQSTVIQPTGKFCYKILCTVLKPMYSLFSCCVRQSMIISSHSYHICFSTPNHIENSYTWQQTQNFHIKLWNCYEILCTMMKPLFTVFMPCKTKSNNPFSFLLYEYRSSSLYLIML
jgi:hypothetical protein